MKRGFSLKWLVVLAFLLQGLILVLGYSFLTARYLIEGMDNIVTDNMEQVALYFFKEAPQTNASQRKKFNNYYYSNYWSEQPDEIRQLFTQSEIEPNQLYKSHQDDGEKPTRVIFLLHLIKESKKIYISYSISRHTTSALTLQNITSDFQMLIVISVLSALSLALVILLLSWRVSRPITRLGQWARMLTVNNINKPTPDFSYPELNTFADLIRTTMQSVQESADREQRFLRHTSHELRTPITTIRSNVELLKKIDAQQNQTCYKAPIDRIDRASLTMKHLTETLLWLHHGRAENLPTMKCQLDEIIQHLVEEMRYLLASKQVTVDIQTQPHTVCLPEAAARIVLGNLIRNAFQHTWEGKVDILQQHGTVQINNQQDANSDKEDLGFGLGLQLTERLCQRLGWSYRNEQQNNGHYVTLNFPASNIK
ncbi:sensor histidine kinase [Spartinivicinus ruber]|uniref:sensor histidine kinase n=1 Tax=Spartinivicinus ruber TaxID=2683272 RepID=UPI0013D70AB7|nr:HAMP domain-containing sensor histidine kinase [Spartinivicinus ruber]